MLAKIIILTHPPVTHRGENYYALSKYESGRENKINRGYIEMINTRQDKKIIIL